MPAFATKVEILGHLLALFVTQANEQARARVGELSGAGQDATGESVELAYVDQGYTGERPAEEAGAHGMRLEVVKHEEAKRGFVLLPRRWIVERAFSWLGQNRRMNEDYERLTESGEAFLYVAMGRLMVRPLARS